MTLSQKQIEYLYSEKNINQMREHSFPKVYPNKNCEQCNSPLKRPTYKFCSVKCSGIAHGGINHPFYGIKRPNIADRMRNNNPMRNKVSSEKMVKTFKERYKKGFITSFWKGKKRPDISERNRLNARKGEKHHFYGKHHPEETRKKISETKKKLFREKRIIPSNLGKIKEKIPNKICIYCNNPFYIVKSHFSRTKCCSFACSSKLRKEIANKKKQHNCGSCGVFFFSKYGKIGYCKKCISVSSSNRMKKNNPICNPEVESRMRKTYSKIMKEKYKNNEEKLKFIKRIRKGMTRPTKPERTIMGIIEKYNLPYRFVGNGGFWIENMNPDFVNCNGDKIVIEVFGDYYHNPEKSKICTYERTEKGRTELLAKYGWRCLVLWESEIKNSTEEQIVQKINGF